LTTRYVWANGKHHGHTAGTDVTKEIMKSPHKLSALKKLKKVGMIVAQSKPADTGATAPKKSSSDGAPVK
jgi:predicted heme/steroid binding protein